MSMSSWEELQAPSDDAAPFDNVASSQTDAANSSMVLEPAATSDSLLNTSTFSGSFIEAPSIESLGQAAARSALSESCMETSVGGSEWEEGDASQAIRDVVASFTEGDQAIEHTKEEKKANGQDDERLDSLQSFEQIGENGNSNNFSFPENSLQFENATNSNFANISDSGSANLGGSGLQSFEQISDPGGANSLKESERQDAGKNGCGEGKMGCEKDKTSIMGKEVTEGIPNARIEDAAERNGNDVGKTISTTDTAGVPHVNGKTEKNSMNGPRRDSNDAEVEDITDSSHRQNGTGHTDAEITGKAAKGGGDVQQPSKIGGPHDDSSLPAMVRKALGGSREEFYSTESLQSLASFTTATSSSSSGRLQDFYSPVSSPRDFASPREMDTSGELSFRSIDSQDSSSEYDSFHDVQTTPQDRTPTNTPPPIQHTATAEDVDATPRAVQTNGQPKEGRLENESSPVTPSPQISPGKTFIILICMLFFLQASSIFELG
jgi:hypothetical protein